MLFDLPVRLGACRRRGTNAAVLEYDRDVERASEPRAYRAGEAIRDLCRACKLVREHTVIVVDGRGRALRVMCGFCGSQHNYRGGSSEVAQRSGREPAVQQRSSGEPFDLVADRERTGASMSSDVGTTDLEQMLRRIIREETGLTPVTPAPKWRGGSLVLRPGNPAQQEKSWPIETFFHKVVMLRNRLRTLEQQINASALPEDEKLRLQGHLTGCYGTLTSFNILFADAQDQFRGVAGD
jgi:hypothetical protein